MPRICQAVVRGGGVVDGQPQLGIGVRGPHVGLLAAESLGIRDDFQSGMRKAVEWILRQEKLMRRQDGSATGWGYDDPAEQYVPDLDSTCLTLETLVKTEGISLPLLTANALWLTDAQYREPGSVEDGKWVYGDTFRITLALIEYYKKIKQSPQFAPATAEGL